jgi:hypothetical protein
LPDAVRRRTSALAGSAVVHAESVTAGFSNGFAGALSLADGRRVFAKVIAEHINPVGVRMYREEAEVLALMPRWAPVPALIDVVDADIDGEQWVCLLIEHVDGRAPDLRRAGELGRITDLTVRLARLDPCPIAGLPRIADAAGTFDRWRHVDRADPGLASYGPWLPTNLDRLEGVAAGWSTAIDGTALVHGDFRPDNIIVTDASAWAVDWPGASVGAPWVDSLLMLPALAMLDGGPSPADVAASHPLLTGVDPDALDAVSAAALGYFVTSSLLEPPPGLPTIRAFQRAQAEVLIRWLRDRWK